MVMMVYGGTGDEEPGFTIVSKLDFVTCSYIALATVTS
jgi:hypothetical protein